MWREFIPNPHVQRLLTYEDPPKQIAIGILNQHGQEIVRRVARQPIGFIHFTDTPDDTSA